MDSDALIANNLQKNQACDPEPSASLDMSTNSVKSFIDDDTIMNIDDAYDDQDDDDNYDDQEYDFDDYMSDDAYSTLQSQFDCVDSPPGVEASLPWLKEPSSSTNKSTKNISHEATSVNTASIITSVSVITAASISTSGACSSAGPSESSSSKDLEHRNGDSLAQICQQCKQFDVVEDFSDHHYSRMGFSDEQPPKNWAKRIQEEWRSLEKDLPDTISVRVYEARMELLRAVIIGPAGTPYHDGLFVFDCLFPTDYPNSPPMVYYYSGGLRLNPNLYECGKVCLSLLGTWSGKQRENWIPGESTMLQVLVSIQALILNADPYFNEPGYETSMHTLEGKKQSKKYSEDAFIMSLKTMMYTLRKPPKYFEDFVSDHFCKHGHAILAACKAYSEGTVVGSTIGDAVQNGVESSSRDFKSSVTRMMNMLVTNFTRNGSTDCEQFRAAA